MNILSRYCACPVLRNPQHNTTIVSISVYTYLQHNISKELYYNSKTTIGKKYQSSYILGGFTVKICSTLTAIYCIR